MPFPYKHKKDEDSGYGTVLGGKRTSFVNDNKWWKKLSSIKKKSWMMGEDTDPWNSGIKSNNKVFSKKELAQKDMFLDNMVDPWNKRKKATKASDNASRY